MQLSGNYPIVFETSSEVNIGSKSVKITPPTIDGIYCKFGGCINDESNWPGCGYQYFTDFAICGKIGKPAILALYCLNHIR